jgi:hypothetical protein
MIAKPTTYDWQMQIGTVYCLPSKKDKCLVGPESASLRKLIRNSLLGRARP